MLGRHTTKYLFSSTLWFKTQSVWALRYEDQLKRSINVLAHSPISLVKGYILVPHPALIQPMCATDTDADTGDMTQ